MVSKTSFIVLGLVLAVVLLISSEVAARDLVTVNGVEDVKYEDNNGLFKNGGGRGSNGEGKHSGVTANGVEDVKYDDNNGRFKNGGGRRGNGGGRGGNGGGKGNAFSSSGAINCQPNCCGRLGSNCLCC
ncbi:hypothetical protein AQUCO_02500284v1 [Aquilegia coerulea]|uniref:Glycine-rich protein n=1 Tax=Aquilegia coerulea TaxID=218851 RepID=A0A2G5DAG0_AQUCA|nr:hypothetical protein AQUCO_02500284v1 [Aquilegia coerulea]